MQNSTTATALPIAKRKALDAIFVQIGCDCRSGVNWPALRQNPDDHELLEGAENREKDRQADGAP